MLRLRGQLLRSPTALRALAAELWGGASPFSTAPPGAGTASFGYEEVPAGEKAGRVGQVFSSVAPSYDLMNDLMSGGLHRWWKDRLVATLRPFPGMQHLDVAGGTGDVAFRVLAAAQLVQGSSASGSSSGGGDPAAAPPETLVTVCDINPAMLSEGQRKAAGLHLDRGLRWLLGDAERLEGVPSGSMDSYSIAFGIRNVTHIERALQEAYRVLKPGGQFACLEFSAVQTPGLRELYDAYSFNVIPQIGRLVAGDEASYRYLVESIRRFPPQGAFAGLVRGAGFGGVAYESLTRGVVAIHRGFKLPA